MGEVLELEYLSIALKDFQCRDAPLDLSFMRKHFPKMQHLFYSFSDNNIPHKFDKEFDKFKPRHLEYILALISPFIGLDFTLKSMSVTLLGVVTEHKEEFRNLEEAGVILKLRNGPYSRNAIYISSVGDM